MERKPSRGYVNVGPVQQPFMFVVPDTGRQASRSTGRGALELTT